MRKNADLKSIQAKIIYLLEFEYSSAPVICRLNYFLYAAPMLFRWDFASHVCVQYHPRCYHFSFVYHWKRFVKFVECVLRRPEFNYSKIEPNSEERHIENLRSEMYILKKECERKDKLINLKLDKLIDVGKRRDNIL